MSGKPRSKKETVTFGRFTLGEDGEVSITDTKRTLGSIQYMHPDTLNAAQREALAEWRDWLSETALELEMAA